MQSRRLNGVDNRLNAANPMLRLMLCHNELFRLPAASPGIAVVEGTAWVTVNGRDIFLASGESLLLPSRRDSALISALGRAPLILEVFGATSAPFRTALMASPQGKNCGA
jgi:hypothetical protein